MTRRNQPISQQPSHWENIPDNYYEYEGFVYLIRNKLTDQKYIGRKYFHVKKKTRIVGESDWRNYTSSCPKLKEAISNEGKENFSFEILHCHHTRQEVNYAEVEEQIKRNVLKSILPSGLEEYYNGNILSRYFKPKDFGTPEYEQKCKNISVALQKAYASGKLTHPLLGKQHPNKGKKLPQTGHKKMLGRIHINNGTIGTIIPKTEPIPEGWVLGMLPRKARKSPKQHTLTCKYCSKVFIVHYIKKNQKYCTYTCQQQAQSDRMKDKYLKGTSSLPQQRKRKNG